MSARVAEELAGLPVAVESRSAALFGTDGPAIRLQIRAGVHPWIGRAARGLLWVVAVIAPFVLPTAARAQAEITVNVRDVNRELNGCQLWLAHLFRGSGSVLAGTFRTPYAGRIAMEVRTNARPQVHLFKAPSDGSDSWTRVPAPGHRDDGTQFLEASVAEGGFYIVCVVAIREGPVAFSIGARYLTPAPPEPKPLVLGVVADAEFTEGTRSHYWSFNAASGERMRIRVTSTSGRPYFELQSSDPTAPRRYVKARDSSTAELEVTIDRSDRFRITTLPPSGTSLPVGYSILIERLP